MPSWCVPGMAGLLDLPDELVPPFALVDGDDDFMEALVAAMSKPLAPEWWTFGDNKVRVLVMLLTNGEEARSVLISGSLAGWRVIARQDDWDYDPRSYVARTDTAFEQVTSWCNDMELVDVFEQEVSTDLLGSHREMDVAFFASTIFRDIPMERWKF
jgi:hypothetical protein